MDTSEVVYYLTDYVPLITSIFFSFYIYCTVHRQDVYHSLELIFQIYFIIIHSIIESKSSGSLRIYIYFIALKSLFTLTFIPSPRRMIL